MEYKSKNMLYLVFLLAKELDSLFKSALRSEDITLMEAKYLRKICENPGKSQLQLARLNMETKTSAVTYVTRLEKKGFIIKENVEGLRKDIYPSEKGKKYTEEMLKLQDELAKKIFKGYTDDEIKEYYEMTANILKNIREQQH